MVTGATLKVTLLADGWNSSAGGLSTLNRELAIHLSKHPKVDVTVLVPEGACKGEEKSTVESYGITIAEAKKCPGYDPLDWLSFPPEDLKMDVVFGHGVKLGRQVQLIRRSAQFNNSKWVQVVHTAPEDLSKFKCYTDSISKGERIHQEEVDLCKLADLVVPVGPRLKELYSSYLRRSKKDQDIFVVTPGLFIREFGDLEQVCNENADFKVLIFGRGDDEDFELKGYNMAAEAFTYHQLKKKPYHLIFVGAPEGKQEEVRQKLLLCGIAEEQLTVRKFIQNRDRMKDLLCEADLTIMPSKSEGFGLVALEALSAGLPILVGSNSGFAKALESVPFGKSCIVDSDKPTKWAEAIEAVRVKHGMRLKEIKTLRASYEMTYSWKEQCEALVERMWRMVHEPVVCLQERVEEQSFARLGVAEAANKPFTSQQYRNDEEIKVSGTNEGAITLGKSSHNRSRSIPESTIDSGLSYGSVKKPRVENCAEQKGPQPKKRALGTNEECVSFLNTSSKENDVLPKEQQQPLLYEEKKASGANKEGLPFWNKEFPQISGTTLDPGILNTIMRIKISVPQDLSDRQQKTFDEMFEYHIQEWLKYNTFSATGLAAFMSYLLEAHNLILKTMGIGCLVIEVQCPTLESLESLWNDYRSGHLNEVAENYLVTDEIKRKFNLETVRLKTTIEEENYLICKEAFMKQSREFNLTGLIV